MNRDFVFNHQLTERNFQQRRSGHLPRFEFNIRTNPIGGAMRDRPSAWSRTASTLNRWLWGALCCGVPGVPCYFCTCCERLEDGIPERDRPRVNQATATAERMSRPHRPHAPRGRKHTPETLSAVRCALNQLQGEPAPPVLPEYTQRSPEPNW